MQEKVWIDQEFASRDKIKLKEHIQNNNNIDLAALEKLNQEVSDMKRRVVEANTDKAQAKEGTTKAVMRERQTALERDEVLKLVTQQEMDMALKQSELEKALQHVSDQNLVFGKEDHQKKEGVQSVGH